MATMIAEDLEGKDDEYVHWPGEYKLRQRLHDKAQKLQEISYHDPHVLHTDQKGH